MVYSDYMQKKRNFQKSYSLSNELTLFTRKIFMSLYGWTMIVAASKYIYIYSRMFYPTESVNLTSNNAVLSCP